MLGHAWVTMPWVTDPAQKPATYQCSWTTRFLIITFISEHKNGSNTHRFEMNKNTYIGNESSNNFEVLNPKYQEIRIQSIVFVTSRIPNSKIEVPLTKK